MHINAITVSWFLGGKGCNYIHNFLFFYSPHKHWVCYINSFSFRRVPSFYNFFSQARTNMKKKVIKTICNLFYVTNCCILYLKVIWIFQSFSSTCFSYFFYFHLKVYCSNFFCCFSWSLSIYSYTSYKFVQLLLFFSLKMFYTTDTFSCMRSVSPLLAMFSVFFVLFTRGQCLL